MRCDALRVEDDQNQNLRRAVPEVEAGLQNIMKVLKKNEADQKTMVLDLKQHMQALITPTLSDLANIKNVIFTNTVYRLSLSRPRVLTFRSRSQCRVFHFC